MALKTNSYSALPFVLKGVGLGVQRRGRLGNFSWTTVHIWALMWQQCVQQRTGAAVLGHFLPTEAEKEVGDQPAERLWPDTDFRSVRSLSASRRDGGEACPHGPGCVKKK